MKGADSNLIAILLWKQTSFRDDKYLACRCSTLNEIRGTRAVTSCEECEDSLKAHKKGKQESDPVGFTAAHKLPLKHKALSREKREQASAPQLDENLHHLLPRFKSGHAESSACWHPAPCPSQPQASSPAGHGGQRATTGPA